MRLLIVLGCLGLASLASAAELTSMEKRMAQAIHASVQQAGASYAAGEFEQAGAKIRQAMKQIEIAVERGSDDFYEALVPIFQRVEKAHTMLEFEGVSLPPFRRPPSPSAAKRSTSAAKRSTSAAKRSTSAAKRSTGAAKTGTGAAKSAGRPMTETAKPPKKSPPSQPEPPANPEPTISFTKTVAPILVSRCGRCHIGDSKGGFDMSTFAALMKGPPEGVVIFPGDTIGSRLIETIETGDMPRGGGKVTAQELKTLKEWIVDGAKYDGGDPDAPLGGGPSPSPAAAATPQVRRATGKETVSFAADVAPLLVDNCNGCHIDAMQTRGGLRMDTLAQLLRGGDSGAVVSPGKGEASLLVQKLRGKVGQRMPAGGRPALSDDAIQLISTWIDEGAVLDGASENQPLRVMSQLAWAASATSEQMSERRRQLAEKNMQLVTASGGSVEATETDHFLVIGSASAGTMDLVGRLAEEQMKTAESVVSGQRGEDFFHGRATIFVFPKRYDYSEFAKMVERRSVPSDWTSHWEFDGIDAYVALVAGERDDEDVIADRLTAPLVSLAVATRGGDVPRWLAEGAGVATASRKRNSRDRDARRRAEAEISAALATVQNAKQFLDGKLSPEQSDRIGAAIATSMLDRGQRRNFDALLRNLGDGKSFDQAFLEAFRTTPAGFVESWLKWIRGG